MKNKHSLMLKYMISEGFNPNNYQRILELLQSAPLSLSKDLKQYNPYLLSKRVNYQELDYYGINGAYGYLQNSEILVPKIIYNDDHFLYQPVKRLYKRYSYGVPSVDEFDTVVFFEDLSEEDLSDEQKYSIYNAVENSLRFKNSFFGFITSTDYQQMDYVDQVIKHKIDQTDSYKLSYETVSEENKKLYLIKKRGTRT